MTKRDDGGPAFPFVWHQRETLHAPASDEVEPGMYLRDWFAGQALAGLLAGNQGHNQNELAWLAYAAADAMLVARKTEGE